MGKKFEIGILAYMEESWGFAEAFMLLTVGLLLSTYLMRWGIFTATALVMIGYSLAHIGLMLLDKLDLLPRMPSQILEDHPEIEYAILLLFPIGYITEHLGIFSLRPLTTLPPSSLPPYSTTTQALTTNPEILLTLILIIGVILTFALRKKK